MDVAPDGSPVAFYARLPATGEPEMIHALAPPGSMILLRQLLADAGLAFERWLDRPGWFIARPAPLDVPQGPGDPTSV